MKQAWSIRPYKEGDEEGIFELWKAVYPAMKYDQEKWMRWWQWMYKENPVGPGRIWMAEDDNKIVAHHPLVFIMLKVGNRIMKASYSIDRMTHPDYRHQGIASKVQRQVLDEAERQGVCISLGTPNEASHAVDMKTGYFDIARKQIVCKPLNWGNAIKLRSSNRLLSEFGAIGGSILDKIFCRRKRAPVIEGLTISRVQFFDERINEFCAKVSNQYEIMVVRNKEYLNWRYVAVPDVSYSIYIAEKGNQIYGYLVLRCMQQEHAKAGVIFDILAESQPISHCLISRAVEHCEREKADIVYGIMIADKILIKAFKNNGFISNRFLKDGWIEYYSSSPPVSKEFLKDPKNWFVQVGDSDQI